MNAHALFIGTGASLGVPVVGCKCDICLSGNPKNKRWRSSLYLSVAGKELLIDAGPDLRSQALHFKIEHLDGVIFTHAHHDHSAGIDDLRVYHFKNQKSLPCLVSNETAQELNRRFYFMFMPQPHEVTNTKRLELKVLETESGEVNFLNIPIRYFSYKQVGMSVLGIRIGSFAYVTDIKEYSEEVLKELEGVETLVLSALRYTASHMHLSVDEAVDFIKKINPKRAYLTHISHELEHEKTNAYLPAPIELAYDGLKISI